MTNIAANLYEDNRGRFFKLIDTDEELINYCELIDNDNTHEDIQDLYEKLEINNYLDAHRIVNKRQLKLIKFNKRTEKECMI